MQVSECEKIQPDAESLQWNGNFLYSKVFLGLGEYTKNYWGFCFKWINVMVCKLCSNKVVLENVCEIWNTLSNRNDTGHPRNRWNHWEESWRQTLLKAYISRKRNTYENVSVITEIGRKPEKNSRLKCRSECVFSIKCRIDMDGDWEKANELSCKEITNDL